MSLFHTVNAEEGKTYAFKYRVRNIYGWSDYSATTFILAASVPSQPPKPTFISSTDNSITVQLYPSLNSHGSTITAYVLEMDDGSKTFAEVTTYKPESFLFTHTVTFAHDSV